MQDIPKSMRAMLLTGHGGMDKYVWREDYPTPTVSGMQVLIKVGACGLNNTDVNTRSGWYASRVEGATTGEGYDSASGDSVDGEAPSWGGKALCFPRIQGADAVGRVVAIGDLVDSAFMGKRVMVSGWIWDWDGSNNFGNVGYFGSEIDGGFAEYARIDVRDIEVVESALSDAELATFSCSYTTAEGMLERAGVCANDTVLVSGASGGVGSALIQLGLRRGARMIGMASASKHAELEKLRPHKLLPRSPTDLRSQLRDEKITVCADIVGGEMFPQMIDVLERGGRYVCSGAIAGAVVPFDLRVLYLRDLTFYGSTVTPRDVFRRVVGYIERGEIKPLLAATYPLEKLCEAQATFICKMHAGNIVVLP